MVWFDSALEFCSLLESIKEGDLATTRCICLSAASFIFSKDDILGDTRCFFGLIKLLSRLKVGDDLLDPGHPKSIDVSKPMECCGDPVADPITVET
jgi:hypothetical protein